MEVVAAVVGVVGSALLTAGGFFVRSYLLPKCRKRSPNQYLKHNLFSIQDRICPVHFPYDPARSELFTYVLSDILCQTTVETVKEMTVAQSASIHHFYSSASLSHVVSGLVKDIQTKQNHLIEELHVSFQPFVRRVVEPFHEHLMQLNDLASWRHETDDILVLILDLVNMSLQIVMSQWLSGRYCIDGTLNGLHWKGKRLMYTYYDSIREFKSDATCMYNRISHIFPATTTILLADADHHIKHVIAGDSKVDMIDKNVLELVDKPGEMIARDVQHAFSNFKSATFDFHSSSNVHYIFFASPILLESLHRSGTATPQTPHPRTPLEPRYNTIFLCMLIQDRTRVLSTGGFATLHAMFTTLALQIPEWIFTTPYEAPWHIQHVSSSHHTQLKGCMLDHVRASEHSIEQCIDNIRRSEEYVHVKTFCMQTTLMDKAYILSVYMLPTHLVWVFSTQS